MLLGVFCGISSQLTDLCLKTYLANWAINQEDNCKLELLGPADVQPADSPQCCRSTINHSDTIRAKMIKKLNWNLQPCHKIPSTCSRTRPASLNRLLWIPITCGQRLVASETELGGEHWWGFLWEDQQVAERLFGHSLAPTVQRHQSPTANHRTACQIDRSWRGFISVSTNLLTHTHTPVSTPNTMVENEDIVIACVFECVYVVISLSKWGTRGPTAGFTRGRQTNKQGKSLCIWLTFLCTNTHANTEFPVGRQSSARPFVEHSDN